MEVTEIFNTESLTYFLVELWVIHATCRCYVLGSFLDYLSKTVPQIYFICGMVVAPVKAVGSFSCKMYYDGLTNKLYTVYLLTRSKSL